jgi:MFS family permease
MFGNRSIWAERARPDAIRNYRGAAWLAVGVVCFGAFMGQLDASIVTLTFRPMQREFGAPLAGVQWVSLIYLLTLVALLAPMGRISDARGRKLIYSYGFAAFTLASAACAVAPSLHLLVAFRLVQAVGAAMLQANSVALVATSVPESAIRRALGVQAAAQALGLALGPTLGGILTETAGWRAVYWINVPVGCVAVIASRYLLPRTRQFSPGGHFDWPGTALLGLATTCLLLALSAAGGLSMPGWAGAGLAVVALVAAAGFAVRERSARFPLVPPAFLRSWRLAVALAGALCGYLMLFGPLVLIPQVLAAPGGVVEVGLLLSALPLGFGLAALGADAVLPRGLANRYRGVIGGCISTIPLGILAFMPLPDTWLVLLLAVAGIGLGVFVPANNTVIMRSAAAGSAAALGGLVNMARGIGTTLGIALITLAVHASAGSAVAGPPATHGARLAAVVLAVAGTAATLTALAWRTTSGRDGSAPAREEAARAVS